MALNAFTREMGTTQGRIVPVGWVAPAGSYVFCLGRDLPGLKQMLRVGDYVQVQQTANFAGIRTVHVRARTRAPALPTAGAQWVMKLMIDTAVYVQRVLVPGRVRDYSDLSMNTAHLAGGNHTIKLRLELVAV